MCTHYEDLSYAVLYLLVKYSGLPPGASYKTGSIRDVIIEKMDVDLGLQRPKLETSIFAKRESDHSYQEPLQTPHFFLVPISNLGRCSKASEKLACV